MGKFQNIVDRLQPSTQMPIMFVGHGNPMNAIYDNDITRAWAEQGSKIPDAQAIVVVSAHWLTHGTHITDAPKQKVIYDFYGFPDELYEVDYKAKGDPEIARILKQELYKYEAVLDSTWGLDHGTWSVLKHLAPEPTVPVLQISIDADKSLFDLYNVFKELKSLRKKGVVFIGSGNLVHNLRHLDFDNKTFDWALEFDDAIKTTLDNRDIALLANPYKLSKSGYMAVPTDEHYRPMIALMGLLDEQEEIEYFNEVIDAGSIGMRSFVSKV